MFVFEKALDFDSRKEVKAMRLNAGLEISEMDGLSFAVFTKEA